MKRFELKITIEEDNETMNRTCSAIGYISQVGKAAVLASVFRGLHVDPTTEYGDLLIHLSKVVYSDDMETAETAENTEDTENKQKGKREE